MLSEFYRAVTPAGKRLVYTTAKPARRAGKRDYFEDYSVRLDYIESFMSDKDKMHGYISVQSSPLDFDKDYYATERKRDEEANAKAFYFDLDVWKEGDPEDSRHQKYKTVEELESALAKALDEGTIAEPNYIVRSGSGGLHLWYILRDAVSIPSWESMYKELAQALIKRKFRFDTAVGSKAHMLIRAPGSTNYKPGVNQPVTLEKIRHKLYSSRDFRRAWDLPFTGMVMQAIGHDVDDSRPRDGSGGSAEQTLEELKVYPTSTIRECRWTMAILAHGTDSLNYDQYASLASVCRHVEGGPEALHKASKDFVRYDPAATDQLLGPTGLSGPISCRSLLDPNGKLGTDNSVFKNSACQGCPALGAAKKDQIYPVLRFADAAKLMAPREQAKILAADDDAPTLPETFVPTEHIRGEMYWGLGKEVWDGKKETIMPITQPIFWISERLRSEQGESSYRIETRVGNTSLAPPTALNDPKKLCDALSEADVAVKHKGYAAEFFQEISQQEGIVEYQTRQQMGWKDAGKKFVTYDTEYYKDGTEGDTICDDDQKQFLTECAGVDGDLEGWRTAVDPLFQPGAEPMLFAMAYAAASPIIDLCKLQGDVAMVALYSPDSGTGKTTTLKVCSSLFGKPVRSHTGYGDTALSMRMRLGFLNHLPACIDELTTMDSEHLRDFVYATVQGYGKQARKQNGEARPAQNWALGAVCTTNESFWTALSGKKKAVIDRIFEYYLTAPVLDKKAADSMTEGLDQHHGVAGPAVVKKLQTMDPKKLKQSITAVREKLQKSGYSNDDRFTINAMALAITGLLVMKTIPELNVPQDAIKRLTVWLAGQGQTAAEKRHQIARDGVLNPNDLYAFVQLDIRTVNGVPKTMGGGEHTTPMDWCWQDDEYLYVRRATVNKWLSESRTPLPWNTILSDWVHRGYTSGTTVRPNVKDQQGHRSQPTCFAIKLESLSGEK